MRIVGPPQKAGHSPRFKRYSHLGHALFRERRRHVDASRFRSHRSKCSDSIVNWAELAALAETGQFILVAGALFVAYFQLRHLRRQQEAALIQSIFADLNSEVIAGALDFVYHELPLKLTDAAYLREIAEGRATAA